MGNAIGTVTILDDDLAAAFCPAPETIDYGGFTAADCAVPQVAVSVFNQAELDAYRVDFGFNGSKLSNLKVKSPPTTCSSPALTRTRSARTRW
jgi:hypothetical protein